MNPTKSVKCIEIDESIFEKLYDYKLNRKIAEIQERFEKLKEEVSGKVTRWMKLKDTEYFFDYHHSILFPDTRVMQCTYLDGSISPYFWGMVDYFERCDENEYNQHLKKAQELGMIIPKAYEKEILGCKAQSISSDLIKNIINNGACPCIDANRTFRLLNSKSTRFVIISGKCIYNIHDNVFYNDCSGHEGALVISICQLENGVKPVDLMIKYGLYPRDFDDNTNKSLQECHEVISQNIDFSNFKDLKEFLVSNKTKEILGVDLRKEIIEKEIENYQIDLDESNEIGNILKNQFDSCDYIRARIQRYNSKWYLSDEGKGHWELWEKPKSKGNNKSENGADNNSDTFSQRRIISLKNNVIARNPIADVRHDAVVGIDFGTKSTIVAVQDGDEQIIPLRIGMADYSVAPEPEHFENPTVMQFVNLGQFIKCYSDSVGRPMTSWNDLMISHEAFKSLIDSENSMDAASFVTDIKQWAGGKYRNKERGHLIIKDVQGYRYDIDDYMKLTDEDIDLIEIYAYYIGLFINNMHTGIYLDYILSFPESFSKEVKERIVKSFTKGIKKAIPEIVFEDEVCTAEFRVRQGPSEPAAYAACALEQYGIEPTDDGVFYGIFDFGGGTTDYDYGIWKNAPEDEYTYNYIIKHYGSGGDKTLGGENILQLLAYNVFSDNNTKNTAGESNLEIMRKNKLVYYRPEEGKIISGTEALNNSSESAMLNTKLMMEALRPIWEEWQEVKDWYSKKQTSSYISIVNGEHIKLMLYADSVAQAVLSLFSENGRENVTFNIDMEMVERVINERIECGVRNFFEGLVQAYKKFDDKKETKIHIFLAGNSSKSGRVISLFKYYVAIYNELMFGEKILEKIEDSKETEEDDGIDIEKPPYVGGIFKFMPLHTQNLLESSNSIMNNESDDEINEIIALNEIENSHFILYPPLGTDAAKEIQKNNGVEIEGNDIMLPTGKTGVAFGLVMCREGSMIKVESEIKQSEQIKSNFYIGLNYRKKFMLVFDRNIEYGKWMKFSKISADTETFEFYYSELPEVTGNDIEIKNNQSIYKRKCLIDNVNTDAFIYFRFISPTQLEYVAAEESKIELGEYISKTYTVNL